MVAPIFKFRNIQLDITTEEPVFVYGVVESDAPGVPDPSRVLAEGTDPSEVSTVILTIQVSNYTGAPLRGYTPQTVTFTAWLRTGLSVLSPTEENNSAQDRRRLVYDYPLIPNNSFDPLNGNLVLTAGDQLWVQADLLNATQVIVSMLEIANATAS